MPAPSIVPSAIDETVYLVVDDLGRHGRAFVKADVNQIDLETILQNVASGQYANPVRIVAFNRSEGWSRDVTQDVALELLARAQWDYTSLSTAGQAFVEFQTGKNCPHNGVIAGSTSLCPQHRTMRF